MSAVYPEAVGVTAVEIECSKSIFPLLVKFGVWEGAEGDNALVRERLARRLCLFKDLCFLSTTWE